MAIYSKLLGSKRLIQLNLFKTSRFYLCFQAYSGKKVKNLIEVESYVKTAKEVLTYALEEEVGNKKKCVQFEIKIYVKSQFGSLVANFNLLFISLKIF